MIKLKHLIQENTKEQLDKISSEIDALWAKYKDSDYKDEELKNKIDQLGVEFQKIRDADPHERGKHRFMKHHYTGHIDSSAYTRYEKDGGLKWLGSKSKYPKLLDKGTYGPYEIEFRQSGEKLQYVAKDEKEDIKRDGNGNVILMTPEEIKQRGLPEEDTSIVAFHGDKPIGLSSDEFGAVGVWVEKSYQKLGIGTDLLEKYIEQRPDIKSGRNKIGQMTDAGVNMVRKYYDKMAKKYGSEWYDKWK